MSCCWHLLCDFQLFTSPGLKFLIYKVKNWSRFVVFKLFFFLVAESFFIKQYLKTETACLKDIKIELLCLNPGGVFLPVHLPHWWLHGKLFEILEPCEAQSENHQMRSSPWISSSSSIFEVAIIHLCALSWAGSQPCLAWQLRACSTRYALTVENRVSLLPWVPSLISLLFTPLLIL